MSRLRRSGAVCAAAVCSALLLPAAPAWAAEPETAKADTAGAASEFEVKRKLRAAEQLLEIKEYERAVGQLESMLERHPESKVRFQVLLALGRHFLKAGSDPARAIGYLKQVEGITKGLAEGQEPVGEDLDTLLESLYLTGVAWFEQKKYDECFPILRRIVNQHPNTVWANQAYFYIGMAHFLQKSWGKAISYLGLVGTYIDPEAETAKYVEAGQRIYIKVADGDLPILQQLGRLKYEKVQVSTSAGDSEELDLLALSQREKLYIATAPSEIGPAKKGDGVVQVIGGDRLTVRYADGNTQDGTTRVPREKQTEVVSTASAAFTDATYEGKAKAAYTGHPMDLLVMDADRDTGPEAQVITAKVQARYLAADEEAETDLLAAGPSAEQGPRWEVRDEVEVTLIELPPPPPVAVAGKPTPPPETRVHTGRFAGRVQVDELQDGAQVDRGDQTITCRQQDVLVVTYIDERHAGGTFERVVENRVQVIGPWKSQISQTDSLVADPMLESRKAISEGEAYLAMAEIFKSMGLLDGAQENADEGLTRANMVISREDEIAADVRQSAFKLRWELYLTMGDLQNAILTCRLFTEAFPDSRFADEALMAIGRTHAESGAYPDAVAVFKQILALPDSPHRAEAQFRLAQVTEAQAGAVEPAIPLYQAVADGFPDSKWTGEALGKIVVYLGESKDYAAANNLLTVIFEEHPDKDWLDAMLMRWIIVLYRMGDLEGARRKAQQFLFEYPDSGYASKVIEMQKTIDKKMKGAAGAPASTAATEGEDQ